MTGAIAVSRTVPDVLAQAPTEPREPRGPRQRRRSAEWSSDAARCHTVLPAVSSLPLPKKVARSRLAIVCVSI